MHEVVIRCANHSVPSEGGAASFQPIHCVTSLLFDRGDFCSDSVAVRVLATLVFVRSPCLHPTADAPRPTSSNPGSALPSTVQLTQHLYSIHAFNSILQNFTRNVSSMLWRGNLYTIASICPLEHLVAPADRR